MSNYIVKNALVTIVPGDPGEAAVEPVCRWEAPVTTVLKWVPVGDGTTGYWDVVATPGDAGYVCTPGSAGVPATPTEVSVNPQLGWDSGAHGVDVLAGDSSFSFGSSPQVVGAVVGVGPSSTENDYGYGNTQFGFYLNHGLYRVVEAGAFKTGASAFVDADRFKVSRHGSGVHYYVNDVEVYVSTESVTTEVLQPRVSLYSAGDAVFNASVAEVSAAIGMSSGASTDTATAVCTRKASGTSASISSESAEPSIDGVHFAYGASIASATTSATVTRIVKTAGESVGVSTSSLTARKLHKADTSFESLTSFAAAYPYAASDASFESIKSYAEGGMLIPRYAISSVAFVGIRTEALILTGESASTDVSLNWFTTLSADHAYAAADVVFEAAETFGGEYFTYDGVMVSAAPAFEITASGVSTTSDAAMLVVDDFEVAAYSGGVVTAALSDVSVVAAGTTTQVGRSDATVPQFVITATGLVGAVGQLAATFNAKTSSVGYGGGYARVSIPELALTGTATSGAVGRAEVTTPDVLIVASGTSENFGRLELSAPEFFSLSGIAYLMAPVFELTAVGTEVLEVEYTTYAVNLKTGFVTQYDWNFDFLVEFRGGYYGVRSDGIYSLSGATDDGAAIVATADLAPLDFNTQQQKRLPEVILACRTAEEVNVTLRCDEREIGTYLTAGPTNMVGAHNRRAKLPRGASGRYIGLKLQNQNGAGFDVAALDLPIEVLSRKL